MGQYYIDFVTVSCFTLFPLLKEDGLSLQYLVITPLYYVLGSFMMDFLKEKGIIKNISQIHQKSNL